MSSHTEIYFFNFGSSGCIVMPIVGTIFLTFSCLLNRLDLTACSLTIVRELRPPLAELALGLCILLIGSVLTGDNTVETKAVGDLIDSDIDFSCEFRNDFAISMVFFFTVDNLLLLTVLAYD